MITVESEFSNFANDWQKDISFFHYIISFDIFFDFIIYFMEVSRRSFLREKLQLFS